MVVRIDDLKNKEVITIEQGIKLGYIGDVEIDCKTARLSSIVVYGRPKFFGLWGREDEQVIVWENISVIGDDIVLVNFTPLQRKKKNSNILSAFFEIK